MVIVIFYIDIIIPEANPIYSDLTTILVQGNSKVAYIEKNIPKDIIYIKAIPLLYSTST